MFAPQFWIRTYWPPPCLEILRPNFQCIPSPLYELHSMVLTACIFLPLAHDQVGSPQPGRNGCSKGHPALPSLHGQPHPVRTVPLIVFFPLFLEYSKSRNHYLFDSLFFHLRKAVLAILSILLFF